MKRIFKDQLLNDKIYEDGYVFLPNFLNLDEIHYLLSIYNENTIVANNDTAFSSYENEDIKNRRIINQAIRSTINDKIANTYEGYRPLTGIFISKPPNSYKSKIILHFDSNCIEEIDGYESTVLWVALNNTDIRGGGLQLFRGSHKFMSHVRPFEKPFCYNRYYSIFEKYCLTPMQVNAGDAIIFLNRTMHMSENNYSNINRVAFRIDIIPNECSAVQLYGRNNLRQNEYIVYYIDDNYYERFTRDIRPDDSIPSKIKLDTFEELNANQLQVVLEKLGYGSIPIKFELFKERLFSVFR